MNIFPIMPIITSAATITFITKTYTSCKACAGTGSLRIWDQYATSGGAGWKQVGTCSVCNGTAWSCTEG